MTTDVKSSVRENCVGITPLAARLESWMTDLISGEEVSRLLAEHGSPLNLLSAGPFKQNISSLKRTAAELDVDFEVYFARKSNKCLSFVDAVREMDCGIDTASLPELEQVLSAGVPSSKVICTAAVKSFELLQLCVDSDVVVAVDNLDELNRLQTCAAPSRKTPRIALRISGFTYNGEKLFSRFGFDIDQVLDVVREKFQAENDSFDIIGIHFHLDGYFAQQRVAAIGQSLRLIDQLRKLGHPISFLDIGGGIPMSYLKHGPQWETFWQQHRQALLGKREALTYRNHGLGLVESHGEIIGEPKSYPYFQTPVQADWLREVLTSNFENHTIASAIRDRNLKLHCEPGRSVLDGCGMTVAKVEFIKQHPDGHWLIGLAMNHTQCRTSSDDFLVDPLVCRRAAGPGGPLEGFLVGAYCTESELLCKRLLRFPKGLTVGDLVVFPNTAGYLMHFLESRSHQFPLAKNVFVESKVDSGNSGRDRFYVDAIDC